MANLKVVCAVFLRADRVLACRRAPHKSEAGSWEFPGGKIELGEAPEVALLREIYEELGENIEVIAHLDTSITMLGDLSIELSSFLAQFIREPKLRSTDHDKLLWIRIGDARQLRWAAPDLPTVRALMQMNGHT